MALGGLTPILQLFLRTRLLKFGRTYANKDTGCNEMRYLGLGIVLDAGDSYRQKVLTGLEGALSRYMQPGAIVF